MLFRQIFFGLAVAIVASDVFGQTNAGADKPVKITLHPMAEIRPALKYQLFPPLLDRKPGNAAVYWNRVPAERRQFFSEFYKEGGTWEKVEQWMAIPLGDPREKQSRAIASVLGGELYNDMARAARFDSCDWQMPVREGNFVFMLLPEVQQLRDYGRLLSAKVHLEIAEKKYGQAVETAQTGLALARHCATGPTLINGLVGTAIGSQITEQLEQFVQQPDSPNLYWALATLPRPLVDYRPGFESESNVLLLQFPELRDIDHKELCAEEWRKLLEKTLAGLHKIAQLDGSSTKLGVANGLDIATLALSVQSYPRAKQYLIDHGRSAASVEVMPVAQAMLVAGVNQHQEILDRISAALFLPLAEDEGFLTTADKSVTDSEKQFREILPGFALLMPAGRAIKLAEARMEWHIARLRVFEALRIYAADHEGKLPERLQDITEVPIPRNPFNNKPFEYHCDGNRARFSAVPADPGPTLHPWQYEITMLPKGDKP